MNCRLLLFAFCFSLLADPCAAEEPPNLLLIVADDMGFGDLSCYGSLQIQTPSLDRLAAGGIRCTDGYVSNSVCAPSRAGLLTGRYGSRFGFEHNLSRPGYLKPEYAGIPLDETLLPERLKELGYRTGIVGKWHLGESLPEQHPTARGFDFFFGMLGGSHPYWPTLKKNKLLHGHGKPTEIRAPYLTDWFTLEALDFIRGKRGVVNSGAEQPWFLYLSYNTPHGPMQAKDEDLARFAHIQNKTRRTYCAMQHCMDQNIGKIVAELETRGELDNTLIVFISDNGGAVEVSHAVNAPLRGTKGTFLEGGIRVPMLYHWPAKLKPSVYSEPVISLDIQARMVAAAGGSAPRPGVRQEREGRKKKDRPIYDGVNLLPFLSGEKKEGGATPHGALYWRMALRGSAVRVGDWKLLRPNSLLPQLYNLREDIGETTNLIGEQPEIVDRLLQMLNAWEFSLERNPMFISSPFWSNYNRRLYSKKFSLVQPKPEDTEDIWKF
ncbi:MAG: sulfatase-like hydrolase/transferase [bacterium]|nr:sulfatase-like hydrolase/transferase [bacterium]